MRTLFLSLLVISLVGWSDAQVPKNIRIEIGPAAKILPDEVAPSLFLTRKGAVVVQGFLPAQGETLADLRWGTVASTDEGTTWHPRSGGPYASSAVEMKDGTIIILEGIARGPENDGTFIGKVWESTNDWSTLAGPSVAKFHLPDGKGGVDDGGNPGADLMLHRSIIETSEGDLLATAYGWFKDDVTPSSYEHKMDKFRCLLLRSKDRGHNWFLVSTIAVDPAVGEEGFGEPVLVQLKLGIHKGRLIVLMRTGSNKAKWPNPLYQTESDDNGETWSPPHPLSFDAVNVDLIEMKSGVLVAAFGWRTKESRQKLAKGEPAHIGQEHGNYLAFSLDQGQTWTTITHITHEPTTGYVGIREIEPGKILLVYDIGDWDRKQKWAGYEQGIDHAVLARVVTVQK